MFRKYAAKETEKMFTQVDVNRLVSDITKMIPDKDVKIQAKMKAQIDYLGYIDIVIPELKDYGYVLEEVDTRYTPKVQVYRIDKGEIVTYKISKRVYKNDIFAGDVIMICGEEEKVGDKKVGEKLDKKTGKMKPVFQKDETKKVQWISE